MDKLLMKVISKVTWRKEQLSSIIMIAISGGYVNESDIRHQSTVMNPNMPSDYRAMPVVYIVFGLPGSGKSYFASRWAEMINASYVNSDQARKEMYEHPTYSIAEKESVYQHLLDTMKKAINDGRTIVLDATFSNNHIRRAFEEEGVDKASVRFIEITTDESITRERLKEKRLFSDADYKVYMKLKEEWHGLDKRHLVLYSTQDNIDEMLRKAKQYFRVKTG
jgi:predicted kinase